MSDKMKLIEADKTMSTKTDLPNKFSKIKENKKLNANYMS